MDGQELRRIRQAMDLTQAELARRVGTDKNTITRYERGVLKIHTPVARFIRLLYRLHKLGIVVEGIEESDQ